MFSFTMSGQRYDFDETADLAADELFAIADIVGIGDDDPIENAIGQLAAQLEAGQMTIRGARAIICIAWLAHRRSGGSLEWPAFQRKVVPATLQLIDTAPADGDGGPQRPSATRQRPKSRTKKP